MTGLVRSPRVAGALLRKARLDRGWTQQERAERMNVRQATVSKLESGVRATRMAVLFDALAALGLERVVTRRRDKSDFKDMFRWRAGHPCVARCGYGYSFRARARRRGAT